MDTYTHVVDIISFQAPADGTFVHEHEKFCDAAGEPVVLDGDLALKKEDYYLNAETDRMILQHLHSPDGRSVLQVRISYTCTDFSSGIIYTHDSSAKPGSWLD